VGGTEEEEEEEEEEEQEEYKYKLTAFHVSVPHHAPFEHQTLCSYCQRNYFDF